MLDAFAVMVFEFLALGLGRLVVRIVTLGKFNPEAKHDWWIGFVGVASTVFLVIFLIYIFN